MNTSKITDLKNALSNLFLSGADGAKDQQHLLNLLEDIDFEALLQGMCNEAAPVYAYHAFSEVCADMEYFGPVLFPSGAVLLYEEGTDFTDESVSCFRALELWLLPDMTFAVTSRFTVEFADSYETVYRTFKGSDWQEAGMYIDFEEMADNLITMSIDPVEDGLALYEI